jgi:hypothetical protein
VSARGRGGKKAGPEIPSAAESAPPLAPLRLALDAHRTVAASGRRPSSLVSADGQAPEPEAFERELRDLRAAVASLRLAAETLQDESTPVDTARALRAALVEEAARASATIERLAGLPAGRLARATVRPLRGRRLLSELARRAGRELDLETLVGHVDDVTLTVQPRWVEAWLAAVARLRRHFAVGSATLAIARRDDFAALDLVFVSREPQATELRARHAEVLGRGEQGESSLADEARAAGGEAWLAIRRGDSTFMLRVLLPLSLRGERA